MGDENVRDDQGDRQHRAGHDGKLIAVGAGSDGGAIAAVSTEGESFADVDLSGQSSVTLHGVAHGAGRFVAVHSESTMMISADGTSWSVIETGLDVSGEGAAVLNGIVHAAGRFVAVGENGAIVTSGDGLAWVRAESTISADLTAVAHAHGKFVAASDRGDVLVSVDGHSWSLSVEREGSAMVNAAFSNGNSVVMGANGAFMTSLDAEVWTKHELESEAALVGIAYKNGRFIFATDGGAAVHVEPRLYLNAAVESDGSLSSVWFGSIFDAGSNYYYQSEHGWLYCVGENEQSIFTYHFKLGAWTWSGARVYPFVYSYAEQPHWLYYVEGSGNLYYDFASNSYITVGD